MSLVQSAYVLRLSDAVSVFSYDAAGLTVNITQSGIPAAGADSITEADTQPVFAQSQTASLSRDNAAEIAMFPWYASTPLCCQSQSGRSASMVLARVFSDAFTLHAWQNTTRPFCGRKCRRSKTATAKRL